MSKQNSEQLMTVHELATLLRVPESWIYNHRYYNRRLWIDYKTGASN